MLAVLQTGCVGWPRSKPCFGVVRPVAVHVPQRRQLQGNPRALPALRVDAPAALKGGTVLIDRKRLEDEGATLAACVLLSQGPCDCVAVSPGGLQAGGVKPVL